MRLSLDWLSEFVEVPEVEELAERLTMLGVEVEDILHSGGDSEGVVVGFVEECTPHPESDKLSLATVFDGKQRHQVVCGAPNVRAGFYGAFAPPGSRVGGQEIVARAVRGVSSGGMLCSRAELGCGQDDSGLWELGPEAGLGENVFDYYQAQPILELGITPNRPDLLSHYGVAREVAAAMGTRVKGTKWRLIEKGPAVSNVARVVMSEGEGCKRYVARAIKGLKVGPSPKWLRERLEALGERSINNVVDATNYALFEYGQPLHAFDLTRLEVADGLPTLYVRHANEGEEFLGLDAKEYVLSGEDVVIADRQRAHALAGVIGGSLSEVGVGTTSILLECACFDPIRVRKSAKRHGLHTHASHRFERGSDIGVLNKAVDRCAQLIVEVAGGEAAKGVLEVVQKGGEPRSEITLRLDSIERILGIQLTAERVVELLEPLHIHCEARNEDVLRFMPPSFRLDLQEDIDLIEEVARRYGYAALGANIPGAAGEASPDRVLGHDLVSLVRRSLLLAGYSETVHYAFNSKANLDLFYDGSQGEALSLLNPLSEDLDVMRTTLLPGMLATVKGNMRQGCMDLQLFEIGQTFHTRSADEGGELDARDALLPKEILRLGVVLGGRRVRQSWCVDEAKADLADMLGLLEFLEESLYLPQRDLKIERLEEGERRGFSPFASAVLRMGSSVVGVIGEVHPRVLKHFDVEGPLYGMELDLMLLESFTDYQTTYRALPRFPASRRDLALVVDEGISVGEILHYIEAHAGGELGQGVVENVGLFDIYRGPQVAAGKVSVAFAIEYRDRMRTLRDEEVSTAFETLLAGLRNKFHAQIR